MIGEFVELAEARRNMPWAMDAVPRTGNSLARLFKRPRDFVAMVRKIQSPTLVIHGLEDRLVSPTSVEWVCSLRPDWDLVQLEDAGHTPQLDAPIRLVNTVLPWLDSRERSEIGA